MNDLEHVHRAAHATALQENPVLQEALEAWIKDLMTAWENSPARDAEGREKLFLMVHASKQFQKYVQTLVDNGKIVTDPAIASASSSWRNWLNR
ncbi:MAG: hypothetical protein ING37_02275 [Rhodocyclaceae bacterium]|jgi:hypothetical protein|nr:hypothetical protein [Rhodocyclaceae bacterium]MCA3045132.1 hypothetical protein [Rhodocyclaceae bacterium]